VKLAIDAGVGTHHRRELGPRWFGPAHAVRPMVG
jgi:hypothetical protein